MDTLGKALKLKSLGLCHSSGGQSTPARGLSHQTSCVQFCPWNWCPVSRRAPAVLALMLGGGGRGPPQGNQAGRAKMNILSYSREPLQII